MNIVKAVSVLKFSRFKSSFVYVSGGLLEEEFSVLLFITCNASQVIFKQKQNILRLKGTLKLILGVRVYECLM